MPAAPLVLPNHHRLHRSAEVPVPTHADDRARSLPRAWQRGVAQLTGHYLQRPGGRDTERPQPHPAPVHPGPVGQESQRCTDGRLGLARVDAQRCPGRHFGDEGQVFGRRERAGHPSRAGVVSAGHR